MSTVNFEGQQPIIVVTGGNRGIGYEICRQLALRKARVVLTARSSPAGKAAVAALQKSGLSVDFLQLDVADPGSITALRQKLEEAHGRVNVLINNAGIFSEE